MKARRRLVVVGATALAAPRVVFAQAPGKPLRVGFLVPTTRMGYAPRIEGLRTGLRELGYIEGKNLLIEYRSVEDFPSLPPSSLRSKSMCSSPGGTPATLALKRATSSIPIVIGSASDPVATGLVANLARPGGQREMAPAAKGLGPEMQRYDVRSPSDFEAAFAAMAAKGAEALVVVEDAMLNVNSRRLGTIATERRLVSIGSPDVAIGGGAFAYGVDQIDMFRRAAHYIDKIARGAKPGDLPIERVTKFEMIVNMKAIKALGIALPQTVLIRADRVIEQRHAPGTPIARRSPDSPPTKQEKSMEMQMVKELMLQSLEHEMGGTKVYETALKCAVNEDLKEEWERYRQETEKHVQVLHNACLQLEIDPEEQTPGRKITHDMGASLVAAMEAALGAGDQEQAQCVAAECVVLAETVDHFNWQLIGEVAKKMDGAQAKALKEAYQEVEDDEDEHLYHSKGWLRELSLEGLGLKAQLPPPEEKKKVKSASAQARVEQSRRKST